MKVSVIIVNYNVKHFLQLCLHSVQRAIGGIDAEVLVVDNNSGDGSVEMVQEQFPDVQLIANKDNRGFSKANNQAVALATGEYILFLNPDTVMPEDFFSEMLPYMDANPKAGSLGPRLIDGKGSFCPDGKRSFPTLSVAIFKATGINKLFPRSPYFNKYYAVHIGEFDTAPVEGLSGCCMLVRVSALRLAGNGFDEDYFMYAEDVDMCYRINQAGYQNIYFPRATLIHYKGESTRKSTLAYVRIFNEALATFVRKHYGQQRATLFLAFLQVGIFLRAVLGVLRNIFRVVRMPLIDALVLWLVLWVVKDYWLGQVKNIMPIPMRSIYLTFPAFVGIWIGSMFLNGAYDVPYRGLRVVRGMIIGTVVALAYYGLLPFQLRHSRAIVLFAGGGGALVLLAVHELLYRTGIIKVPRYDAQPRKAVLVADQSHYQHTLRLLQGIHYAPDIIGRISPGADDHDEALAPITHTKSLLQAADIDEVIFCVNGISYNTILALMQECGPRYDYKIHPPHSQSFVGSNSSFTAGDSYATTSYFAIARLAQRRNKRLVDIGFSTLFLLLSPLLIWGVHQKRQFILNALAALFARRTWIGYSAGEAKQYNLPAIRKATLPPWHIRPEYQPDAYARRQLAMHYAEKYHPSFDISFLLKNFRFLGRKDFAENES
jgi:GT2 family glycosyltransferase